VVVGWLVLDDEEHVISFIGIVQIRKFRCKNIPISLLLPKDRLQKIKKLSNSTFLLTGW